jgi:5-methylthioribose kinase
MGHLLRARFAEAHHDVLLLEPHDHAAVERYLLARNLIAPGETPARVARAGEGNMNLTLRVALPERTLILKQGRPWVEKYPHIEAPWERTLIEGRFYRAVAGVPAVAGRMPGLVGVDPHNHILILEDLGAGGDLTPMYRGGDLAAADLRDLLAWLDALGTIEIPGSDRPALANRAMRALNHEHIFRFPLAPGNGLALDDVTPGLGDAAAELTRDDAYVREVAALGAAYLADGPLLVHGDYFPGSWVRTPRGLRVIDPEFGFLGAREFDYGVLLAHLALARVGVARAREVVAAAAAARLDEPLVIGFAGVEIMRRLIGVAQLPLHYGLDVKRRLLGVSRALVFERSGGLSCW